MILKKIIQKINSPYFLLWLLLSVQNTAFAVNWVIGNIASNSFPAAQKQKLEEHYSQSHIITHGNTVFFQRISTYTRVPRWLILLLPQDQPVPTSVAIYDYTGYNQIQPLSPEPPPSCAYGSKRASSMVNIWLKPRALNITPLPCAS